MTEKSDITNLLVAVLFTISGITVPMLFHILGIGPFFLPMYLPLSVGSFLLNRPNAALVGLFTPLISAITTGMPPFYPPVAFIMMIQLSAFCTIISFLHRENRHYYFALVPAIVADRLILAVFNYFIMPLFSLNPLLVTGYDLLKGLPGIMLMMIIVPIITPQCVRIVDFVSFKPYEKNSGEPDE